MRKVADYEKMGKRLREARRKAKMTQVQLAAACDCDPKHISAIENGTKHGLIDKDEYAYAKKRYNGEYEQLLEEENRLFSSSKKLGNIVASSNKWIQFVKEYRSIPDIDRNAVDYLVKRINLYPNKRIEIILNYEDPFRLISEYVEEIPEVLENVG